MSGQVNSDGSFKEIDEAHVKINGVWKRVSEGHVKINGVWKEWYRIPADKPNITSIVDVGANRAFNNGSLTVSFVLPPGSQIATQGYRVTATSSGNPTIIQTGANSPITLTGFRSNTPYSITVIAINDYGESDPSTAVTATATTVPQTIGKPTAVAKVNLDTLSWTAPANGGQPITLYRWQSTDSKTNTTTATSVDIAQEPNTSQQYRVRAENANGVGDWSVYSDNITTVPPFFPFFPYFPPYFPPFFPFFPPYFRAGCVHGETVIQTSNGPILAKNVEVGDKVLSFKISEKQPESDSSVLFMWESDSLTVEESVETEIVRIIEKGDSAVMYFNDNKQSKYSITQPVFVKTNGSYKIRTTGSLEIGDVIVSVDQEGILVEQEITDITIENELDVVYQIDCEPYQWFVAGGYLLHNK